MLGTWLDGSGWTRALVEAGIATSGTTDSFLKVSHLTKTRIAHQVTAAALSVLQHQAHDQYRNSLGANDQHITFDDWCDRSCTEKPHFLYLHLTLKLELTFFCRLVLTVKKIVDLLTKFVPWCFALDLNNYARWLPVHIRDLVNLIIRLPELDVEFKVGN